VGTLGVGIINSTAFSLLANSSLEVDENQISFGTVDFQPHTSNFTTIFESMDQDMDLTIGSLNFRVGSLGLLKRLILWNRGSNILCAKFVANWYHNNLSDYSIAALFESTHTCRDGVSAVVT
jgi:hypothetical protein